jgi:hypothetical protein
MNATTQTRAVFFDGPFPTQDKEGEEQPVWSVYVGLDWETPTRKVYTIHNYRRAEDLAKAMARDRKLELVSEAMTG